MAKFISTLWLLVRPYRFRLGLGVLIGVLAGLMEPFLVVVVKLAIDGLFPSGDPMVLVKDLPFWAPKWAAHSVEAINRFAADAIQQRETAMVLIIAIPAVMFLRGCFTYLNIYFLQWAASRAITDLRVRLFEHIFSQPMAFFHRNSTGELMSRLLSDVSSLQNVISNMTSIIIKEPFTLVGLFGYLIWQNPRFTLAALVVIPVCVVPVAVYGRKVRKTARKIQSQFAEISQIMHESFSGARIIKAYNLEPQVVQQFANSSRGYVGQYMRLVRAMEIPGPLIEFFGAIGVALFLFYVSRGAGIRSTAGDFLQLVLSIFLMYKPIKSLARLQSQFVQARAASERVFDILEQRSDLPEPASPVPLRAANADIHFDRIDFRYADNSVVRGVDLVVPAGKLVALVGPSGSGKTTLTNLLLRFYDPQEGAVRIGGVDIRQVATRDLRSQIAVVTQEPILFNDTIRNNLRMGRPSATDAEIEEAARHAHAHEFIMAKPAGYDEVVGEKGSALSGGQRQRLAIARAILRDAPILILDEATSALDTESERVVQAALEELMQGRTTICIAHRLSTVQNADFIVVLDQGRIVEQGKHSELLARNGLYRKLYDLQFKTDAPESNSG